ncbi:MAG: hypothetical protein HFJ46_05055 [Clostridia bacterium]|nr:hypothetical protein [Clostridia bacterium]
MKKTVILTISLILIISFVTTAFATSEVINNEREGLLGEYNETPIEEIGVMPIDMDYPEDDLYTTRYNYEDEYTFAKDDLLEAKSRVEYEGLKLNGNAFIFSKDVYLKDTTIKGNIFVCAENVKFDNVLVEGSVYLASNSADLYVYTQDAYIAANHLTISPMANITRTVKAVGNEITLSGTINKNCYIEANELSIDENCTILGDLEYLSNEEIEISKDKVNGNIKYIKPNKEDNKTGLESFLVVKVGKLLSIAINTFIIAGIILLLRKNAIKNKKSIVSNILSSLGLGLIALIMIPSISLMLVMTVVGAGIGVILFILYLLILLNSISVVALETALLINSHKESKMNNWQILVIAILIALGIGIIRYIPVVKSLVSIILPILSIGIVIKAILRKKEQLSEESIKEA